MQIHLNAICPYFTMFPLEYPLRVLSSAKRADWVLDPFCGRGTTNFAARLKGLPSIGIDSSPVAAVIAKAKVARTSVSRVVGLLDRALKAPPVEPPTGDFWKLAFHHDVLQDICQVRGFLSRANDSNTKSVLQALMLGALHGPVGKHTRSYLSNQCMRTFSPKPAYAVKYWRKWRMLPPQVTLREVIKARAERYLRDAPTATPGRVYVADSRSEKAFSSIDSPVSWIVTSPPYYGLRTYIQDQWLRFWFLGGPSDVGYGQRTVDLDHGGADRFADQLRKVWLNASHVAAADATMCVRFGGISDRNADPRQLLKTSLADTPWRLVTARNAGLPRVGRRQAEQFQIPSSPIAEYDFVARLR